ncbi:MAG: mannose-6-phosphate isomerase, class I [Treponema sp.]|nr:mannose-6-phosphate isomerase, class I [Treponema sp.]
MAEFYRLDNQIKHYEWGSPDYIPGLLGIPADGRPHAELWMGGHPGAPSRARLPGGLTQPVEVPYLFKLLAAEKPLSIQAHPSPERAREGFDRENREGLAPDAPNRNYRDPNHKPEIICALTPFTGMCGFRAPGEIAGLLAAFMETPPLRRGLAPLLRTLEAPDPVRGFLAALFALSRETREAITDFVLQRKGGDPGEWAMVRGFAGLYPGDPAIIAPLYLNVFRLQPGEAVFLKAGVLHAYVRGFGVELMANSDNVLRGGLTTKHVDVPELMKVLDFSPLKPRIIRPDPGVSYFTYPVPCREFSLAVMRGNGGLATLAPDGPSICIVTEGEACVNGEPLRKGESIFVPPAGPGLEIRGSYTLHVASTGRDPA